jgi:hypothetical protein
LGKRTGTARATTRMIVAAAQTQVRRIFLRIHV